MAEVETPPVTAPETLVPIRLAGETMLDRWINNKPEEALQKIDTMVRVLNQLRDHAIRQTYPTDWVIHSTIDRDGVVLKQVAYLQDSGAERAGKVWGIEVGQPAIRREDFPDGTVAYHMESEAWSKVTGERIERCEGSRWGGDKFFQAQLKEPTDKIDPTDVSKAAYANLHGRAVRALGGLSAIPVDVLKAAGIDTARCMFVGYSGGTSATGVGGAPEVVVAFGNSKGKRPAELEDKDLAWYLKAYTENVADPAKAKFQKANQRVLDALKAEQERRAQATAHEAETGTKADEPAAPSSRGQKMADLLTRLSDAAKKDQRVSFGVLRLITKERFGTEIGSPTDLTDEQLNQVNAVPDSILATLASQVLASKDKK